MDTTAIFKDAQWIGVPQGQYDARGYKQPGNETAYFRLSFQLAQVVPTEISISASSRYRLWVNGKPVVSGPCKGDRWRHYYETVDISPYLAAGENTLAVKVVSYPPYEAQHGGERGPIWMMAKALGPCLIVAGKCLGADGQTMQELTTGVAEWTACLDEAVQWRFFPMTQWMGSMEEVQGSLLPRGWKDSLTPQGHWAKADTMWPADHIMWSMFGIIPTFPLKPRPIPLLFETERSFAREMPLRASDCKPFTFTGRQGAVIPPHTKMAVELDAGEHMTGYLRLALNGGRGSKVTLRYAESYSRSTGRRAEKGRRDDWEHYEVLGHEDTYFPSGGEDEYEPFWFRTFRFVRIEAETAEDGLTIGVPGITETGYPLDVQSRVESSEAWVGQLWDISVRTLRRCMHETYEDCPYYEQLQYIQDTRLEMLFTYMASGDTRLALRAIEDFHCSLLPDGMLQARYPSQEPHVIPPFSLHWISMLAEYYSHTGDAAIPRRYRPTADAILDWYDRKLGKQGLVENLGYWDQIDWVDQWSHIAGRTPAGAAGPAAAHNLMYAYALQAGAAVNRATGREGVAAEYEQRAAAILANVQNTCWSGRERLYMEGPGYEEYSQHTQVYAVLTGLISGQEGRALLERALRKPGIALCSFTWQFFLFRALEKCGAYELTEKQWELWKALLSKNLTTVPEVPDGKESPRSDCHAWGALPLYEFTRYILGVRQAAPGWQGIVIEPRPLSLPDARGQVITPKGPVKVAWTNGTDGFKIEIDAPAGVPVTLVLPDGSRSEHPGGGQITAVMTPPVTT